MAKNNKNKNKDKNTHNQIANFIYETGIHSKTPRSGFWFLGSGEQSVAEHLFHTAMIAYTLAHLEPKADKNKMILMALVHDIGEGRTSDHNYVHQRYGRLAEGQAVSDISASVPFGKEIMELFKEEQTRTTLEAKLVKDADILEWIVTLRGEEVKGNEKAKKWIDIAMKRLKTNTAKKLGKVLLKMNPDDWWFDADDKWFVDRKKIDQKWDSKKKK
jgi:putative hydrolase of HD superfamily